jgi:hypothetical protein
VAGDTAILGYARRYGFAVLLLIAFAVQCLSFLPLGYGSDEDGWGIIGTWIAMKDDGIYVPSRNQGNLVPELAYGQVAHWGGSLATSGLSLVLSLVALAAFWKVCRQFMEREASLLAVAFVASSPFWVFRSVISTDYMLAISSFLVGMLLYRSSWTLLGILALAMAGSSRLQYAPLGLVFILVSEGWTHRETGGLQRLSERAILFVAVQGLFYVPAFIASHLTLSFLHVFLPPEWTPFSVRKLGSAFYKPIQLLGFPATLAILASAIAGIWLKWYSKPDLGRPIWQWAVTGAALAGTTYLIYFNAPLEREYLLPLLFVVAAVLAASPLPRSVVFLIAVLMIVDGYYKADVLELRHRRQITPCEAIRAESIELGFSVRPGVLATYRAASAEASACMQKIMAGHLSEGGVFGGETSDPTLVPDGILPP